MSKLTPKASKILLKVANLIEINPKFYNQDDYSDIDFENNACETTCCVAGWVDYVVNGPKMHMVHTDGWFNFHDEGKLALSLTDDMADELFNDTRHLPIEWKEKLIAAEKAKDQRKYARTGASMIRHFVKKYS